MMKNVNVVWESDFTVQQETVINSFNTTYHLDEHKNEKEASAWGHIAHRDRC